jgi:probable HAF family extracellular repeat protein
VFSELFQAPVQWVAFCFMYTLPIRLHKRIVGCALLAAILSLPLLAHAGFAPTYSVTDLGVLSGSTESISVELNNQGHAIGIAIGPNDKGVLFRKGKVIDLDPSAVASYASGINAEGKITGYFNDGTKWEGFIYHRGNLTGFQAPGAVATFSESLNDVGQTAGYYEDAALNDHLFVRQANGVFQDLGSAFGINPSALAINNQGRVLIGSYDDPQGHAYISRPGSASIETIPPLIPNGGVSPGDMNQIGVVVGWAAVDALNQRQHAFVYFEGKIKDLGVLPGGDTTLGNGINNFGQTVGSASQFEKPILNSKGVIVGYTPEIDHGWVSLDGKMLDLNGLLNAADKGWEIMDARSINDRGEILADADFQDGSTHAVLLLPNLFLPGRELSVYIH